MRVCVFVDGENLRHSIVDLFKPPLFDQKNYLPDRANWTEFFDQLVLKASKDRGWRIRTYWYVINLVDPFPFVLRKTDQNNAAFDTWLADHSDLLTKAGRITELGGAEKYARLEALHNTMWGARDAIKRRFEGFHVVQNKIAQSHDAIEFRRSGCIGYNLLTKKLSQEKTVDVNLAVDMLQFKDNYDMALVVSGDQDYVPAVQAVKDYGKLVVNVAFQGRDGKLLPGGSRRLNDVTDWSIAVPYAELQALLGIIAPDA